MANATTDPQAPTTAATPTFPTSPNLPTAPPLLPAPPTNDQPAIAAATMLPPPPVATVKPHPLDGLPANPQPLQKPPLAAAPPPMDYSALMTAVHGPVPHITKFMMDWADPANMKAVSDFRQSLNTAKAMAGHEGAEALTHFYQANPWAGMLGMPIEAMANTMYNVAIKNGMDDPAMAAYNTVGNNLKLGMLTYDMMHAGATGQGKLAPNVRTDLNQWLTDFQANAPPRVQEAMMKNSMGFAKAAGDLIPQIASMKHADYEQMMSSIANREMNIKEANNPLQQDALRHGIALTDAEVAKARAAAADTMMHAQWYPQEIQSINALRVAQAQGEKERSVEGNAKMSLDMHNSRVQEGMLMLSNLQGTINNLTQQLADARSNQYKLHEAGMQNDPGAALDGSPWKNAIAAVSSLEHQQMNAIAAYNRNSEATLGRFASNGEWQEVYKSSPTCGLEVAKLINIARAKGDYDLSAIWKGSASAEQAASRRSMFPVVPVEEDSPGKGSFHYVNANSAALLNAQQAEAVYGWATQPETLKYLRSGRFPDEAYFRQHILGKGVPGQDPGFAYAHFLNILDYVKAIDYQVTKTYDAEKHIPFNLPPPAPHRGHPLTGTAEQPAEQPAAAPPSTSPTAAAEPSSPSLGEQVDAIRESVKRGTTY